MPPVLVGTMVSGVCDRSMAVIVDGKVWMASVSTMVEVAVLGLRVLAGGIVYALSGCSIPEPVVSFNDVYKRGSSPSSSVIGSIYLLY